MIMIDYEVRDIRKKMVWVRVGIYGEDNLNFIIENRIEVGEDEKGNKAEYRYENEKIGRTWKDGNNGLMCKKKNIYNI